MKKPRLGQVRYRMCRAGDGQDSSLFMTRVIECFYGGDWRYVGPAGPSAKDAARSSKALRKCVDGVLDDSIDAIIAEATT